MLNRPYYFDEETYPPRCYQLIAINIMVEAIASGKDRVFLVMATGTGKIYMTPQIQLPLILDIQMINSENDPLVRRADLISYSVYRENGNKPQFLIDEEIPIKRFHFNSLLSRNNSKNLISNKLIQKELMKKAISLQLSIFAKHKTPIRNQFPF